MTIKANAVRDELRTELVDNPYVWFDVSYRIKYNSIDDDFEVENVKQIKSTNKSEDGE